MEPILFVMAIMGCGEGDAACREVRVEQAQYHSQAACMAQTDDALMRNTDLSYPTIVARCRRAGVTAQPLRGSQVLLPPPALRRPLRVASR